MSEIIERVAKAIFQSHYSEPLHEAYWPDRLDELVSGPPFEAEGYREMARAAIKAMRGPLTQEMGLAFTRYWHDNFRDDHVFEDTPAQKSWEGMIDAALQAPDGAG